MAHNEKNTILSFKENLALEYKRIVQVSHSRTWMIKLHVLKFGIFRDFYVKFVRIKKIIPANILSIMETIQSKYFCFFAGFST